MGIIQSKIEVDGYASKEELLFSYYISELINNGWVEKAEYQPTCFKLSDEKLVHVFEKGRTKNDIKYVKLANDVVYTADWKIIWNKRAEGVFYWVEGGVYEKGFYPYRKARHSSFIPFFAMTNGNAFSFVDVKGSFSSAPGTATFSVKQKWLASMDVYVQKIIISLDNKSLFAKTFTPRQVIIDEVYKKDCKHGKAGESKLKFKPILIEQWTK